MSHAHRVTSRLDILRRRTARGALVASVLLLLGTGCDLVETLRDADRPTVAPSAAAEAVARVRAAENAQRAPDMASIGGREAMRVYYQFVDDGGRVHFVERLAEVPTAWQDRVGFVEMNRPPPLTPAEARASWTLSRAEAMRLRSTRTPSRPRPTAGGRQVARVSLYWAVWCGYCTKARSHLDREGVDYEIRDVDIPAIATELREKTGRGGVPVLDYDGRVLRGYRAESYDRAIDAIRGV